MVVESDNVPADDAVTVPMLWGLPGSSDPSIALAIEIIEIPSDGDFMDGNYQNYFNFSGTPSTVQNMHRAPTLIHELGHALNILNITSDMPNDGPAAPNGALISGQNTMTVARDCFGLPLRIARTSSVSVGAFWGVGLRSSVGC
jgi:hypothetical protein